MDEAVRYNAYLHQQLVTWAGSRKRFVDFGAGNGRFAFGLKAEGLEIHAVETDPALRARISAADIPAHPSLATLEADVFDGIYTLNVLEHIEDDEAVLALFEERIRPGGGLFVYVPAFELLFSSNDTRVGHVRRYRRSDLTAKLERAGFEIDSARYVDCIGFAAAFAYRFFGDRDGGLDPRSIRFYDRFLFPLSRALDRVFGAFLGKNLLVTARKPVSAAANSSS
jgi:SAM-dependent methyltransferase